VGTWEQPLTVYSKEQSLRTGDADELKFGEEQGGIGSASAAHAVARLVIPRDCCSKLETVSGDAGVQRKQNPDVYIF
jgi:hypothetical protein